MLEVCKKKSLLPDNKVFELGSQSKCILQLSVGGHPTESPSPQQDIGHFIPGEIWTLGCPFGLILFSNYLKSQLEKIVMGFNIIILTFQ